RRCRLLKHSSIFEPPVLVFEVAHSRKYHCNTVLVTKIYRFIIAFRTAWLNDCCNALCMSKFYCVRHREKSVAGHYYIITELNGTFCCNFKRTYTVHLTSTDTYSLLAVC